MVARETAIAVGGFDIIEFLDDRSALAVGRLDDCATLDYDAAFVAIGNPVVRGKYLRRILESSHGLVTLIHPRATVAPSAVLGLGSIVEAGAVICSDATVGEGCILMANAVVGHGAKVGDLCQLKYNCTIAERALVPEGQVVACNGVWDKTSE